MYATHFLDTNQKKKESDNVLSQKTYQSNSGKTDIEYLQALSIRQWMLR